MSISAPALTNDPSTWNMRRLLLPALLVVLLLQACATNANMQLASSEDESAASNGSSESDGEGGLFGFGLPQSQQGNPDSETGPGSGADSSQPGSTEDDNSGDGSGGSGGSGGSATGNLPSFGSGDLPEVDQNSEFCQEAQAAMEELSNAFTDTSQSDPLAAFNDLGNALIELSKIAPDEIRADMRQVGQELAGITMLNFQDSQDLFESEQFYNVMSYLAACGVEQ